MKAIVVWILCLISSISFAQLIAEAGNIASQCNNSSVTLGGSPTASGGMAPYTYSWSPVANLNNSNSANPLMTPMAPGISKWYVVTVTDANGNKAKDSVLMKWEEFAYVNAGTDKTICLGKSVQIGGASNSTSGITYSWSPATGLNSTTSPNPVDTGKVSVTYTLTVTNSVCGTRTSTVHVNIVQPPPIDAGADVYINQGEIVHLDATGGVFYIWSPNTFLTNQYSGLTDSEPDSSITYYLFGTDQYGCSNIDSVRINVKPGLELVFYNTFTPNKDGTNDIWYIGNIIKYPNNKVEVYNREGKMVFKANRYANTWDGTFSNIELPAATYYYVVDPGEGSEVKTGSVTIIR